MSNVTVVKAIRVNNTALKIIGSPIRPELKGRIFSTNLLSEQKSYGFFYVNIRVHDSRTITLAIAEHNNVEKSKLQIIFETLTGETSVHGTPPFDVEEKPEPESEPELKPEIYGSSVFYASPENAEAFGLAKNALKKNPNIPFRIMVVGPNGYGKTSMAQRFAELNGMDCVRMNCATIRDPEEWFGYREATDGTTHFVESHFIKQVQAGNSVIILDEFNRLDQFLLNTLYPLMDHDGKTVVMNREFKVGPDTLFVATVNIGYEFTGTFQMDRAMISRFDIIATVQAMPAEDEIRVLMSRYMINEHDAKTIVATATAIREINGSNCSTRSTLAVARLVEAGSTIRSAFQHVVVNGGLVSDNLEVVKEVLDVINTRIGVHEISSKSSFQF